MSKMIVTFKTVKQAQMVFGQLCPIMAEKIIGLSNILVSNRNIEYPDRFRANLQEAVNLVGLNEEAYAIDEVPWDGPSEN